MKKTAFILSLLFTAMPVAAQHGQMGYTGFSWITPAQLSVGNDSNFLVDRTPADQKLFVLSLPASVLPGAPDLRPKRQNDTVLLLKAPTLAFLADTSKRELAFSYQPEFEIFRRNRDQNSWNSYGTVDYTQMFTRRFQVYVGDAYRSSNDPSRTLQNVFLLLPRSRYRENDFRASASYALSERTSFVVRYDNTIATFGQNDPLQRRVLDTVSNGLSVGASRMLRRNHRLRVTYTMFSTSPWNRQKSGDERVDTTFVGFKHPAHSVNTEYRFSINPKTVFELSGGGIRTDSGMNYVFGVFGDRRVGDVWLGAGYSRSLSFFAAPRLALPNGFSSNSFYELLNFHMRGQPTRRIGVNLNITGSRGIYGALLGENKTLMGRARVDYRLNPRWVTFVAAESYNQNRNDYVTTPLSRNRFFTGFEFSFASEIQQRTSRLNRDAENVALTEHGRQRSRPQ
jgi:hypothetical protein